MSKFRLDFVTNSSSSSYTCIICGENICGMDVGLSDGEMYECIHGHIFCEAHSNISEANYKEIAITIIKDKIQKYEKWFKKEPENKYYQERIQELNNELNKMINVNEDEYDFEKFVDDSDFRYECPEKLCPICNFQELTNETISSYLNKKYNIDLDSLKQELVSKFNSYTEFEAYCK